MSVYLQPRNPVGNLTKLEFPYTPQIEFGVDVKYDVYNLTHTNYQPYAYTRSENPTLSLACKFTAHNTDYFNLSAHAIRFLQTYTKMNYGRKDPDRGLPPRIMRFYAYGPQMFHDVPVVIGKYNITFPEDVDYVYGELTPDGVAKADVVRNPGQPTSAVTPETLPATVTAAGEEGNKIWLPLLFTVNITLMLQQNLSQTINEFSLRDFADGMLASKGYI